jgi:hypothetical protein
MGYKSNSDPIENQMSKQFDTVTFRMDHHLLVDLRKESKHKAESLNTLVNQIFDGYVNYHKPLSKIGNIYFSKKLLSQIFNNNTDDQLIRIAEEHVKNELKENLNMLGLQYDLQSFLYSIHSWCERSGFPCRYDETYDGGIYTIRFDLGPKWAAFFAKETQIVLDDLNVRNTEIDVTNNTVRLKFKEKRETDNLHCLKNLCLISVVPVIWSLSLLFIGS